MDKLNGQTRGQLVEALISAYSSHSALQQMVLIQLERNLAEIVGPNDDLRTCLFKLIGWAEERGAIADLIDRAFQHNPGNPALRRFVQIHRHKSNSRGQSIPDNLDTVEGVAPYWSLLDDVRKAFASWHREEQPSPTNIQIKYPAQGVSVNCVRDKEQRWVVSIICLQAPFPGALSYSGLRIGMPVQALTAACTGKYRCHTTDLKRPIWEYTPLCDNSSTMTVVLEQDKVSTILLMQRTA